MKVSIFRFIASVVGLISGCFAYAGAGSSGGGDIKNPDFGAAWFLGERSIQYCYVIAPDFGVSEDEIKNTIENVFTTWIQYVQKNKVTSKSLPERRLILNHKAMLFCDGTEDLKFYFGVNSTETNQAKALYTNPTGFSYRRSYNAEKGWGNGFIWITSPNSFVNWQLPDRLNAQLLHELGHVLGTDHVEGTIMGEDIVRLLFPDESVSPKIPASFRTHIDGSHLLSMCLTCENEFEGSLLPKGSSLNVAPTFKKFTGRMPMGQIRAKTVMQLKDSHLQVEVTLTDSLGQTKIPFQAIFNQEGFQAASSSERYGTVFKTAYSVVDESHHTVATTSTSEGIGGVVAFGTVIDAQGESHFAILDINMHYVSPITIKYIDNNIMQDLFYSSAQ